MTKKKKSSDSLGVMERAVAGDRHALIEYALDFFDRRLRRRVRAKLRAGGVTVVDEDDVFTSVGRRLLLRCAKTGMQFTDDGHLDAYLTECAMNVAREKVRSERSRRRTIRHLMRDLARRREGVASAPEKSVIEYILSRLNGDDRRLFKMRLSGVKHVEIAQRVGMSAHCYRNRWREVRSTIRMILTSAPSFFETVCAAATDCVAGGVAHKKLKCSSKPRLALRSR